MNYPLMKLNKYDQDILTPQNTYYSEEYCARICDLYLTDQLHRNEKGNMQKYYRLHAKHDHTPEMALAYEIKCPKCGQIMKHVTRQNRFTELGLYTCKHCK